MMMGISGMVGMYRNVGNVRNVDNVRNVKTNRQTSSVTSFWNHKLKLICMMIGISGMVGMSGMSRQTADIKFYTFSEAQAQADLNDDGNFRNVGNVN